MITKLVLLPGMDGSGELFADFVRAQLGIIEARVVRYPSNQCLFYSDLLPVVESAVPSSDPFVLLAESFSTPLAILYAATKPPNLKGLILCAGFATSPVRGWKRFLAPFLATILFRVSLPDFAIFRWLIGPGASPSLLAAVKAAVSSAQPQVLSARLRAVLVCDVRADLSRVAVPILYAQATQDRIVPERCFDEIQRIKPAIALSWVAGPHLILEREPQRLAAIVSQFIQRLSQTLSTEN